MRKEKMNRECKLELNCSKMIAMKDDVGGCEHARDRAHLSRVLRLTLLHLARYGEYLLFGYSDQVIILAQLASLGSDFQTTNSREI